MKRTRGVAGEQHECTQCGRSFSRKDHLTRHLLSHSSERPFVCTVCGKAFTRGDLLTRHATIHIDADLETPIPSQTGSHLTPTRKAPRACKACVVSKTRCIGRMPCQRCTKRCMPCLPRDSARQSMDFNIEENLAHVETHAFASPTANQARSTIDTSQADGLVRSSPPPFGTECMTSLNARMSEASDLWFNLQSYPAVDLNQQDSVPDLESYFGTEFGGFVVENLIIETGWEELITTGKIRRASKAFKDSLWYSVSNKIGDHNRGITLDMSAVTIHEESEAFARGLHSSVPQRFTQSTRDSLLVSIALLAHNQYPDCLKTLRSSFPTTTLLNVLVHLFLSRQDRKVDSWIHSASFHPSETNVELTAMIIATSALDTGFVTLRRLGTDLHQLLRPVIISNLEVDAERDRRLALYQALLLNLELDLWQDEAGCLDRAGRFASVIATFLRQELRSQVHMFTFFPLALDDESETAKEWSKWVNVESHKRLIARFCIYDNQLAITLGTRALTIPSEYRIPAPHPKHLWSARNPTDWRRIYLAQRPAYVPSLMDILASVPIIRDFHDAFMDKGLAPKLIFHTIGRLITEFQLSRRHLQSRNLGEADSATSQHLVSRTKELEAAINNFDHAFNRDIGIRNIGKFLVSYLTMSLRVSVADIEVLVGKTGEQASREMYERIKEWPDSLDAREAIWHAGQILQHFKLVDRLTSFQIIHSYHACLVLFAYSVLSSVHGRQLKAHNGRRFCLNDPASASHVKEFLHDASIEPVLRSDLRGTERVTVSLLATKEAMEAASEIILNRACRCEELSSRLVKGLVKLLKELASAIQIFRPEPPLPEF